jgi:hypothetical protein
MPLSDFLYRCPSCGTSPTVPEGNGARCPRCGCSYTPGQGGGLILERSPEGSRRTVPAATLAREMAARGGPGPIPQGQTSFSETRVRFRRAIGEDAIRHGGTLLGYAERFDAPAEGLLRLDPLNLRILPAARNGNGDGELTWALEDIQAIQASSSSIQFSAGVGGVVLLRFLDESPRRWDDLLRAALQARWDALGRGSIMEFQPRIRVQ